MAHPLVSVLMPVYNGERYLKYAIESVLSQSFHDFEFVIIDDGSTDATSQILAGYSDSRLRIARVEHIGLVQALNRGIELCSGLYIARMDADDLSYPGRFAQQVECLSANPEIDVVTCWSDLLDETGTTNGRRTEGVADDMLLELAAGNQLVHGSVLMRRNCLPRSPVYVKPPEDYWLWSQLARAGKKFHCIAQVLYGFRSHGDRYSLTHAQSQSAGIVEVQWPLLEECTATRDLNDIAVRSRLVRGWGSVSGAAYRSGNILRGDVAQAHLLELAGRDWPETLDAAVRYGIESIIWGGCSWRQQWKLRWLEWRRRPRAWQTYRNLLLCLPPIRQLTGS